MSQAKALQNAFTSKVALIQGPPGTGKFNPVLLLRLFRFLNIAFLIFTFYLGKSFIGALIAQMIRENTDESILCVCYTNHALDQFLEHLLEHGEKRIVRIGGRSKSDKVKRYQLRELARTKEKLSREATRRIGSVIAQIHESRRKIKHLTEEMKEPLKWERPRGGIKNLLLDF